MEKKINVEVNVLESLMFLNNKSKNVQNVTGFTEENMAEENKRQDDDAQEVKVKII